MDRRDMMAQFPPEDEGFCEKEMTFHIEVDHCDDECPNWEAKVACECGYCKDDGGSTIHVLPARYEICGTCDGKGTHVNPSIDAHGISREEFDEDPDFRENYFSGVYDVQCYECHGNRVVPIIDTNNLTEEQQRIYEIVERRAQDKVYYDRISMMERMMGA